MWEQFLPALRFTLVLTVVTGLLYPALVTGIAKVAFPWQAGGSLVTRDGRVVGSALIGQQFTKPEYFHPRPSAAGSGYDALASGGSNFGPTSSKLTARVKESVAMYGARNPGLSGDIPPDAVLASASGLDPHISPANAEAQIVRVARARGLQPAEVRKAMEAQVERRDLRVLGEARVNVLKLNLALDEKFPATR